MQILRENAFEDIKIRELSLTVALFGFALFLPFFVHLQFLTGPIINAIFILVLFISGIRTAVIVALAPSMMALAGGLLPAVLAPAVPFIMLSNILYIMAIDWFYKNSKTEKTGYWTGLAVGSLAKYFFLYGSLNVVIELLLKKEIAPKLALLLGWPQLLTALIGGVIAWSALKFLKRM